jgi:geranylgeranyl diphosphate synthase, type II
LILDDLPAMDDAAMRRGRPTCHRAFGEATAVLAAIALMNRAFGLVATDENLPPERRAQVTAILAKSIGTDGLTGGQEGDLNGVALSGAEGVEWIHARKTGALFAAAAEIGAVVAGSLDRRAAMYDFGMNLGLAFQAYDDLLDARAIAPTIGKDIGRDADKATRVKLLGFEQALDHADAQMQAALRSLPGVEAADRALTLYIASLTQSMRGALEGVASAVHHA